MSTSAVAAYRSTRVETATPAQLILMLLDGAAAASRNAREHVESANHEARSYELQKAQRLVTELRCSISFERGGSMAADLDAMYGFVLDRLVAANIKLDVKAIDAALAVLDPLRDGWRRGCVEAQIPAAP